MSQMTQMANNWARWIPDPPLDRSGLRAGRRWRSRYLSHLPFRSHLRTGLPTADAAKLLFQPRPKFSAPKDAAGPLVLAEFLRLLSAHRAAEKPAPTARHLQ